ncbi:MAG: hypothetical protein MK066_03675 [Crocinitomicaceae bacterium]|nr:hypothetical protein [Crocinitomicaceae bacterium]
MLKLIFFLISFFCITLCNAEENISGSSNMGVYTVNNKHHVEANKINIGIEPVLTSSAINPVINFQEKLLASNQQFNFNKVNQSISNSLSKEEISAARWANSFKYSFIFFSLILSLYLALKIS